MTGALIILAFCWGMCVGRLPVMDKSIEQLLQERKRRKATRLPCARARRRRREELGG